MQLILHNLVSDDRPDIPSNVKEALILSGMHEGSTTFVADKVKSMLSIMHTSYDIKHVGVRLSLPPIVVEALDTGRIRQDIQAFTDAGISDMRLYKSNPDMFPGYTILDVIRTLEPLDPVQFKSGFKEE